MNAKLLLEGIELVEIPSISELREENPLANDELKRFTFQALTDDLPEWIKEGHYGIPPIHNTELERHLNSPILSVDSDTTRRMWLVILPKLTALDFPLTSEGVIKHIIAHWEAYTRRTPSGGSNTYSVSYTATDSVRGRADYICDEYYSGQITIEEDQLSDCINFDELRDRVREIFCDQYQDGEGDTDNYDYYDHETLERALDSDDFNDHYVAEELIEFYGLDIENE